MRTQVLMILILVVALISGCAQQKLVEQKVNTPPAVTPASVNAPAPTRATAAAADCGNDTACFQQKFSECRPAIVAYEFGHPWNVLQNEIIGLKDGLCQVREKYLNNTNPKFLGKEMICQLNSSKDFGTAMFVDSSTCEGELNDLVIGKVDSSNPNIPSADNMQLEIRIAKDTYKVGDALENGSCYYLQYRGEPFSGLVVTVGDPEVDGTFSTGTDIVSGHTCPENTIPTLSVLDMQHTSVPFSAPGEYNYTIAVYTCAHVDKALGTKDCGTTVGNVTGMANITKIMAQVTPLKIKTKTISVV